MLFLSLICYSAERLPAAPRNQSAHSTDRPIRDRDAERARIFHRTDGIFWKTLEDSDPIGSETCGRFPIGSETSGGFPIGSETSGGRDYLALSSVLVQSAAERLGITTTFR